MDIQCPKVLNGNHAITRIKKVLTLFLLILTVGITVSCVSFNESFNQFCSFYLIEIKTLKMISF